MRNKKIDKRIILTGGGTTGHVAVNLALIPELKDQGYEIYYLGSKNGIEKELIGEIEGVHYISIATGKLRRYFSWQNFKDFFKVVGGTFQAIWKIFKIRPNIIFSKGGFVSVPVVFGGWVNRVPCISHESDLTPGLANKLIKPFVRTLFTTFPETVDHIGSDKAKFIGPIVRESLLYGDKCRLKGKLDIFNGKKNLLVMGGSLGAKKINELIRDNLDQLSERYNVIHACGKNGMDETIKKDGYFQFEYINEGLNDILDAADIVISRSGSNAIFEFLYYKIPMLLIPFEKGSRGDQVDNARSFQDCGYALMKREDDLDGKSLLQAINYLEDHRKQMEIEMGKFYFDDALAIMLEEIKKQKK